MGGSDLPGNDRLTGKLKQNVSCDKICLFYNADKQKEITSPCGQKSNPRTVLRHGLGILQFLFVYYYVRSDRIIIDK